jgi:hypothetical protein
MKLLRHAPLLLIALISSVALAQTLNNSGRVFPYNGYLELDGFPATDSYDFELVLFNQPTGGTACDTQNFSNVAVNEGRFQVLLTDVPDGCFGGTQMYLETRVGPVGGALVDLAPAAGGRTLIGAVPHAAQASAFSRFYAEVLETILVDADSVVAGDVDTTSLAATTADIGTVNATTVDATTVNTTGLTVRKSGTSSTINFPAAGGGNDPGFIAHVETPANTGVLWVQTSDDWDANTDGDRVVFGEQSTNTQKHYFTAAGNAYHAGNLDVAGSITSINYTGEYTRSCADGACDSNISMGTTTERACFLTYSMYEDIDGGGERARCEVYASGGNWRLRAYLTGTSDANVWCRARCLEW